MPNPSYQKGTRFENKAKGWLSRLGKCVRSFMSRGADLTLTWALREWKISCKCKADGVGMATIKQELEKHDLCITGADREMPMVHMYLPKFIEFCLNGEDGISQYGEGE